MFRVVIIGPPGAGKGTQAARLAAELRVPHISTGEMLRSGVEAKDPTALRARDTMRQGSLIDDATSIELVRARLSAGDARHGFLLDGFPRTIAQARSLDALLPDVRFQGLIVIALQVPRDELLRRLALRQRADDQPTVSSRRLEVYASETAPLLNFYSGRRTFAMVNGAQSPTEVARDVDRALYSIVRSSSSRVPTHE